MSKAMITQARLKELLHYDPDTGLFTWLASAGRGQPANRIGTAAGRLNPEGYVRIGIDGTRYLAHRLVWLYVTGTMPSKMLDHINGVKHDNRWVNLREANHSENGQNVHAPRGDNPLLGAYWRPRRNKWEAQLRVNGVHKHLGYYDTPEKAHEACVAAKRTHHSFSTI